MKSIGLHKFIGLFLFALSISSTTQAQIRLGVKAGASMSNAVWEHGTFQPVIGYQGGLVADFGFLNHFSIQPALLFSNRGYKHEEIYNTLGGRMKIFEKFSTNYVELPVLILYKIKLGKSLRLFTGAGPYWARAVDGKIVFNNGIAGDRRSRAIVFNENKKPPVDGGNSRIDSGLIGAVGLETGKWAFSLNYNHGLVDVGPTFFNIYRTRLSTRSLGLTAGYWFGKTN